MKRQHSNILFYIVVICLLGGILVACTEVNPEAHGQLVNPGFEEQLSGWDSQGTDGAGSIISGGHSGDFELSHTAGSMETTQTLTGLPNGWVTLRAWVRSSGWQEEAYVALKDCGGEEARASVPIVKDAWLQIAVSAQVTHQRCTISLYSKTQGEGLVSFDDVELTPGKATLSVMGADISSLAKSEALGGVYRDENGVEGDALEILSAHGMNYARLRVWANSPDGYHGKAQLLEMAQRLKAKGIQLLVNFHYSDSWADPGKQNKPAAWKELDFEALKQAVYDHTYAVCSSLKAQGSPPDMVQVGNEINNGMLWADGSNEAGWENLAALLKEGVRAVKDCSESTRVMLHIAEGGDNAVFRWWFDAITRHEVPYDVIGVSYYPYWHGNLADLQNNLNDIALRYGKDIIVVETAYPFTRENNDHLGNIITSQLTPYYTASPEGQHKMLADILTLLRTVPGGRGLGFFWWDATWTAVPGNGWDPAVESSGNAWENQALFDFESRPLPAMNLFDQP
jgi:arabinogalactan endo-1,4-beta-galactosidase